MKKSILFVCLLSFVTFGLFAQEKQKATSDSIVFVNTTHDYGTIKQGSDGNYEFKFTNKAKEPLTLSNVQSSCGCTVPEWPKEPILGGKTGVIKVKYNTNSMGSFTKTITVTSNAKNPTVVLTIKGNVIAKQ